MVWSGQEWREYFLYLKQRMGRQKENEPGDLKTELRRCLSTPELTCLGVGNTIGVGIYILLGSIAKEHAGPSTVICFVIAICVTMLNALIYAEFSSSVTQTGASYTFLYKVGGEFIAFLCGWLMFVSMLLSGCVGAQAWSALLDSFFDHSIQNFTRSTFGELQFGQPFAENLDFVAFAFQLAITIIVSCNVRCSSLLNTLLSILTVSVLLFVAGAGVIFGDAANFLNKDNGGFFPFGMAGVIKGSSMAIYACSGFEVVSMSAEEAKNPKKSVPRATVLELITVACVYVSAAIGLLFLTPYWMLDPVAPLPSAFDHAGMVWGKFIVTLGPLFSFTNLQMLNMYGMSRLLYRMASDGLFFPFFLHVHKKTGVPVNSIAFIGILTSSLSLMFDLSFLVEITILLMLITYMFLGSALIKLKMTKPKKFSKMEEEAHVLQSLNHDANITNHDKYNRVQERGSLNNLVDFDDNAVKEEDGDLTSYSINVSAGGNVNDYEDDVFEDDSVPSSGVKLQEIADSGSSDSEDDTLFKKDLNSKRASKFSHGGKESTITHNSVNVGTNVHRLSLRLRIAEILYPFIPGVLSFNLVIVMHWLCCVGLAFQLTFGWRDLMNASIIALLAISALLFVLAFLTLVIWANKVEDSGCSFQTPWMPLVPTLSIFFSGTLFLSSAKVLGFVEMIVLIILGSILYLIVISMDMRSTTRVAEDTEQSMSLIGAEEGSDNDEL